MSLGKPGGHGRFTKEEKKAKNVKDTIRRLIGYMNRQMGTLIMIFASVLLASLLGVAGPYLMGRAIDDYLTIKNLDGFMSIILLMLLVDRKSVV